MVVKLNNETYRIQFIKEVEQRRGGRTTITTICKIFICTGTEVEKETGKESPIWSLFSIGVARQNPVDKYNHLIGKRVALQHAMIKRVRPANVDEAFMEEVCNIAADPDILYHFDRVERSVFAQRVEKEFASA